MNEAIRRPRQDRRRDRRAGLPGLLATVARVATSRGNTAPLRGAFEEALRRGIGLRAVHLRDLNSRWRTLLPHGGEALAFEVPALTAAHRGVLEATPEPGGSVGEWDLQLLAAAAQLGALLLEVERGRGSGARVAAKALAEPGVAAEPALVGTTPAMEQLRSHIDRVARTDFTVLLEGESGVGKELVARQIHERSARKSGPFVAINCAALVETLLEAELFGIEDRTATGVRGRRGKFEHADGGTLFLDEIGDLSAAAQAKLLRAIQELAVERVGGQGAQRVNLRIVAATNRSLSEMVRQQGFRADLYYRLSGVDIHVPSLRERRADIRALADHFLQRHRRERTLRFSESALQALCDYAWPGNVRELERLVERAVTLTLGEVIEVHDLPPHVRGEFASALLPSLQRGDTLRTWACRYARLVYERCDGNKRRAARQLGISNHTLTTYLKATGPARALSPADRVHERAGFQASAEPSDATIYADAGDP